ncbi:MAG: acetylxylan esterase, partial [Bacteroidales bacterium]|nr:acetylxylan esterase [Bacteroidales bacterium]
MKTKKVFKVLGIIIGIILLYFITIIFFPVLKVTKQPIVSDSIANIKPDCKQDVSFSVNESMISGWLYLPDETEKPTPCIILTTGFCGTKDMVLEKYALRFVETGYAVLSFDYRHFG